MFANFSLFCKEITFPTKLPVSKKLNWLHNLATQQVERNKLFFLQLCCNLRHEKNPTMSKVRVVVLPGNGCPPGKMRSCNWYGWLANELTKHYSNNASFSVKCEDMPDPHVARESNWIPFINEQLLDQESKNIVVGHRYKFCSLASKKILSLKKSFESSGAVAAMRLCENTKVEGIVLVSACHTDLGIANERKAGYYNRPWEWDKIKENTEFRILFGSTDDPFIPWREMQHVHDNLQPILLHKKTSQGHFMTRKFPELLEVLKVEINKILNKQYHLGASL